MSIYSAAFHAMPAEMRAPAYTVLGAYLVHGLIDADELRFWLPLIDQSELAELVWLFLEKLQMLYAWDLDGEGEAIASLSPHVLQEWAKAVFGRDSAGAAEDD